MRQKDILQSTMRQQIPQQKFLKEVNRLYLLVSFCSFLCLFIKYFFFLWVGRRKEPLVLASIFLPHILFYFSLSLFTFLIFLREEKNHLYWPASFSHTLFYFSVSLFTFLDFSGLFKGRKEPPVLAGILLGQLFDEKSRGGVSWLLLRIHPVLKKFKKTIERKETDIDKER